MASNAKKRTTMAKMQRENTLREKRIRKQARKDARKRAAEAPPEQQAEADAETLPATPED